MNQSLSFCFNPKKAFLGFIPCIPVKYDFA
jgi:hypothetical protein